jgi:multiple sugar transport system ATP-binding protein
MAKVELRAVRKVFDGLETIHGIDLSIEDGEFCVFVGPSGCGKSTLLRIVAGLETITSGELRIGDRVMNEVRPADRGVAMVFQSYALYPHMNVYDNMAFGLKSPGGAAGVRERVESAARMLQLDQLLDRLPSQLSGGQRQRVAIGRTIVRQPEVFLFDEPLSNLDAALRIQMRMEIGKLHHRLGNTMIYVTHDQVEAMTLADKIVVLNDGRVEQAGAPLDLYHFPASLFVATFLGAPQMNLISGTVQDVDAEGVTVTLKDGARVRAAVDGSELSAGQPVRVGIRPEDLVPRAADGDAGLPVRVEVSEPLGESTLLHVSGASFDGTLIARVDGARRFGDGDAIELGIPALACHLFDEQGSAHHRHFRYEQPERAAGG